MISGCSNSVGGSLQLASKLLKSSRISGKLWPTTSVRSPEMGGSLELIRISHLHIYLAAATSGEWRSFPLFSFLNLAQVCLISMVPGTMQWKGFGERWFLASLLMKGTLRGSLVMLSYTDNLVPIPHNYFNIKMISILKFCHSNKWKIVVCG